MGQEAVIRWGPDPHAKQQFLAERMCPGHAGSYSVVSCARMAEQIEMSFGFWTRVGRVKRRRCGLVSNYFEHLLVLRLMTDWRAHFNSLYDVSTAVHATVAL